MFEPQMNTDKTRFRTGLIWEGDRSIRVFAVFICVQLGILLLASCSSKPTDLRTLVPAESLVYLESNDLADTLLPIVDAKPFRDASKSRPDFSALKGVQLGVAVTSFETSEEKLTDENSVARVMPRFVTVADTHSWNYAALTFAEQNLDGFVASIYGGEPKLEKTDKHGGKYFTWTANDGRKAYALVIDSLIYFGNDETAIEKCLAVRRGEADSILKTGKIQPATSGILASGYISQDGIAQVAGLMGMQLAAESSDEEETQSAIAGIVPRLIRGTVTEASWTMKRSERGIEDNVVLTSAPDAARVFSETIVAGDAGADATSFIPALASGVTRYQLKDARLAWRSMLLTAQKQTDPISGQIIGEVAKLAAEPYGIDDAELLLASVRTPILTVRMDADGEDVVMVAGVGNYDDIKKSVSDEIDLSRPATPIGNGEYWQSQDGDIAFSRQGEFVVAGSAETVRRSVEAFQGTAGRGLFTSVTTSTAPVATAGSDTTTTAKMLEIVAGEAGSGTKAVSTYVTETRFSRTAIERRTVSDFGLIGSIISFLGED